MQSFAALLSEFIARPGNASRSIGLNEWVGALQYEPSRDIDHKEMRRRS